MKKTLLLIPTLLAGASAMAETATPRIYENEIMMGISQDGRYAVSAMMGSYLHIYDLKENGLVGDFMDAENGLNEYYAGYGRPVALDGSVVGNAVLNTMTSETTYTTTDNAVVFKNNEVIVLNVPRPEGINFAHSITPDGQFICGNLSNDAYSTNAEKIMMLPGLWTRQSDGTYGDPIILPHPDKDFLGGTPQYCTAISMSDDGKTVAGTVTTSSGWNVYPIIYRCDDKGEWSYELINNDLFFNSSVEIPEEPGDSPKKESFMTDEEVAAYKAAMTEWNNTPSADRDWTKYPKLDNYMTDEEKAAYNAAYKEWGEKYTAYQVALAEATEGCITLTFNNVVLSPDGKFYASTVGGSGSGDGGVMPLMHAQNPKAHILSKTNKASSRAEAQGLPATNTPYVFNTEDGSYTRYTSTDGMNVLCAANDGKFVGYSGDPNSYIYKAGIMDPENGITMLTDYFAQKYPELETWVEENMNHEVLTGYDDENETYTYEVVTLTGAPFCTPDMGTITTYAFNIWDGMTYGNSYVFVLNEDSAIKNIAVNGGMVKAFRGGMVSVSKAAVVEVIGLDGKVLFKGAGNGLINTGVTNGIGVIRATFADGTVQTLKAAL